MIASHMVHAPTTGASSKTEIWSNSQNFNICVKHCTIKKDIAFLVQQAPDIWGTREETCWRIEVPKHRSDGYFVYSDKYPILVIKTFALDIDNVACKNSTSSQVQDFWFIPGLLPHPPTLPACELHRESKSFDKICSEGTNQHRIRHSFVSHLDRPTINWWKYCAWVTRSKPS
jgi:hypothetical protein